MDRKQLNEKMAAIVTEEKNYHADEIRRVKKAMLNFAMPDLSDAEKKRILGEAVGGVDRKNILRLILFFFDEIDRLKNKRLRYMIKHKKTLEYMIKNKKVGAVAKWKIRAMRCLQREFVKLGIKISIGGRGAKPREIVISRFNPIEFGGGWCVAYAGCARDESIWTAWFDFSEKICDLYEINGSGFWYESIWSNKVIGRFSFI